MWILLEVRFIIRTIHILVLKDNNRWKIYTKSNRLFCWKMVLWCPKSFTSWFNVIINRGKGIWTHLSSGIRRRSIMTNRWWILLYRWSWLRNGQGWSLGSRQKILWQGELILPPALAEFDPEGFERTKKTYEEKFYKNIMPWATTMTDEQRIYECEGSAYLHSFGGVWWTDTKVIWARSV